MFAKIVFPVHLLDEEINAIINEHTPASDKDVDHGLFELRDSDIRDGEYEELEDILVKKRIPFDRYSEGDVEVYPCVRFYRPDVGYDKTIITDQDWSGIVSTSAIYELSIKLARQELSPMAYAIKIAELMQENDPLITKTIEPIEYYVKGEEDNALDSEMR